MRWTDERWTTRKIGSGRRKVTSARDDRHLLRMALNDLQLPPDSWHYVGLLLQVYLCRLRQFVDVCLAVNFMQRCLYTESPSRQTIDGCVCNGLMSTELDKLIGKMLSFWMNHASICGTMMAAFVFRRYAGDRYLLECVIE
ncbi:uncharacterized protein TNCV_3186341 [Trichonephila clavipes]|nr:uncharacterized protein TNCV_3186341 [Trichonephila clavipes]